LTDHEVEIVGMLARGMTNQEIGSRLELSNYTVQWHLIQIFDKLQVGNRTEAVTRALSMGLLQGTQPGTAEYVVFQN
jgi:ATP/maltotriose-dependent transcriptional regulator MalT